MNESEGGGRADNSSYNSYSQPTNINLPHGDNDRYHRYPRSTIERKYGQSQDFFPLLLHWLYLCSLLKLFSIAADLPGTSSRGQVPAMHPLRDLTPTVATLGRWECYVYINTIVYYINHHIYQIAMSNTIVGPFLSLFGRFMISVHLCYLKSLPAAHAVCNLTQICNMVKYLLINHCFCTLCVVLVSGDRL